MRALLSMKLKKETLRWPCSQDKITSRCVHVLGFVHGKQEEMPACVVAASSCHRARGTASLCMNTRCVLQEDSSENDEVFKSTLFFPCGKIYVQLQTCTLFYKSMFFPYIPSCEAHKQFGAEPAQYGLEINFKLQYKNYHFI